MDKYIAFDCETGGLNPDSSLLTVYFVVLDSDLTTILGELDLKVKPNAGGSYKVSAEALGINGINLIEHDKVAIALEYAKKQLHDFLEKHNPDGATKLIPIGHNVVFDELFVKEHLISVANWNKYVSYRRLDTGTVAEFLRMSGKIPRDVKGSLSSLGAYLGIKFNAHNAKEDTLATVKVLRRMKRMIEDRNVN